MEVLRARLLEPVPSPEGIQADLLVIEPNGDESPVRCLCKHDGTTDIGGDPEAIAFLSAKYGDVSLCGVARQATLGVF